ncbi:hypothetical protein PAPYR_11926 [Paratrimastix pyriformis]|uniref:Kringle domain-containing protein n=1 Tax=Paratrimastix pyriformis TaxID=342808 RepID=A0ABQ8U5H3_9EUKA|nr:hypothetical protein PAPYR_11926 [Paratrimastix pyriformis]
MFGCGARGYTNTGKNWCYALEGLAPVHAPDSCVARRLGRACVPICLLVFILTPAAASHPHQRIQARITTPAPSEWGFAGGSVMLDVSCLLSHRLMPSCLSEAVTALGTFGSDPGHTRGDTVECVPPLSCLMLVLALRHAHSQHQDGYP